MIRLILQRVLQVIPTLVIISIVIFLLQQMLPGDPAIALAGEDGDEELLKQIRQRYNLDKPLVVQYLLWAQGILGGDLGQSMRLQMPVLDLILQRLPVTAQLAAMAMTLALALGLSAGIVSAVKRGTVWDKSANLLAFTGLSVPNFFLAIMLILLFSVTLGWLPASGYVSPLVDPARSFKSMLMPAFVLATSVAAVIMRHTRSAMLNTLGSDYIRTARAKGLTERTVVFGHAMRNALTPVITLTALEFGSLMGGAVLTEQIFNIPGFGKLIIEAVYTRDYAVVQGVVTVTALIYIVINLMADIFYIVVNPKLRT